jgi:D-3-phosphoglycerate dehydrogenase
MTAPPPCFNVVMTAPRLAAPAVALLEQAGCAIHYMPPYPPAADIAALVAAVSADAVLTRQGRVDDAVLTASPRLVVVARHGVGVDDVDLSAAAARGVMVTRAPGSNTRAVSEHTLAFILALAKDIRPLGRGIAGGGWRGGATMVRDVAGLRLGLVGLGAIGRDVATLAAALGMAVAAFDPRAASDAAIPLAADLPALLARSDVVSLHCPYLPQTHHLIDAAALALMPRGSFVVNTARGGLIHEAALLDALNAGHIAGAALDVFEVEPPALADALRDHPGVLVTPHVAGVTESSLVNMGVMAAECIVAALTGGAVPQERVVVSGGR